MRKLTEVQQEHLKNHLKQKNIEYVELYDEIYDHYASTYEQGTEPLKNVIDRMDQTFTQGYINEHRKQLPKRIYRNIKTVYKKQIINFFKWPQIVSSIFFAASIIGLSYALPSYIFKWYILLPAILLPLIPYWYFFIQEHRKLVPRHLKSAAFEALNRIGIFPTFFIIAFNIMSKTSSINDGVQVQPWILGLFLVLIVCYNIITIKVFKQKIKYQMA